MMGKVYLVGAGPGDPKLLTLRGRECLAEAEVVIYDYLANPRLLEHAPRDVEIVCAGKRRGEPPGLPQEAITALMVERARAGKTVVRLKGGDPYIFGRGGEEAEALIEQGVPCEVVPGVTAVTAVPAYAGIPLTHRAYSSSVALVTGHEDPTKPSSAIPWEALGHFETVVLLMGVTNLEEVVTRLRHTSGKPPSTPIALIRWGTRPEQETVTGTLADIVEKAKGMKPPVTTVVGEVVRLREKLNWFEARPLFGKKILVTRTREQASELIQWLELFGAESIECPMIQVEPPLSWTPLDQALRELGTYSWVIFTSVNGVRACMDRLAVMGRDVRALGGVRVCAIGPRTAEELRRHGITADMTPPEYVAEAILAELDKGPLQGHRVLLPRAETAREVLPEELRRRGADVTVVAAYRTVKPAGAADQVRDLLATHRLSAVTFTSSSTVRNFVEMFNPDELPDLLNSVTIASIGPVTAKTVEAYGWRSDIVAREYTIPALVEALVEHFAEGGKRTHGLSG